jgi:hypothetical protein
MMKPTAGNVQSYLPILSALGIIKVQYEDRAFAMLQRLSSHENRKLFDIAQDVVQSRGLPWGARQ